MKLLLTSAGITTQAIADKLAALSEGSNKHVGFINTAANVEPGNKDWYIRQFADLRHYGFDWIDIIDPSAANVDWQTRLENIGILFVSGGNTFHLLDQFRKTGFDTWLKKHIVDFVYVGASAGSIIATPKIDIALVDDGDENLPNLQNLSGLSFVNFEVSPHTPEAVSVKGNQEYAKTSGRKLYAFNDKSAIAVENETIQVIAEGEYHELN